MEVNRFEVWLIALDPVKGKEMKKTRPCLIISPDELNHHLDTPVIAPMTTVVHRYPTRVKCIFKHVTGEVALDQIRAADRSRFVRRLGEMDPLTCKHICEVLIAMFEY